MLDYNNKKDVKLKNENIFSPFVRMAIKSFKIKCIKEVIMIKLTRQQKKAVDYLVKGLTDKEIAHEMGLSISSVKMHLHAVRTKLTLKREKD